jgi:hypothetical protein
MSADVSRAVLRLNLSSQAAKRERSVDVRGTAAGRAGDTRSRLALYDAPRSRGPELISYTLGHSPRHTPCGTPCSTCQGRGWSGSPRNTADRCLRNKGALSFSPARARARPAERLAALGLVAFVQSSSSFHLLSSCRRGERYVRTPTEVNGELRAKSPCVDSGRAAGRPGGEAYALRRRGARWTGNAPLRRPLVR